MDILSFEQIKPSKIKLLKKKSNRIGYFASFTDEPKMSNYKYFRIYSELKYILLIFFIALPIRQGINDFDFS